MTGYICKYAPIEIMAGFGIDVKSMSPNENNLDLAQEYIYPSICCYAKSILQHALKTSYESILFTDCCDAIKSIADVLIRQPNQKIYRISLPRLADQQGKKRYANVLECFINQLEVELDRTFDTDLFLDACMRSMEKKEEENLSDYIGILGARVSPSFFNECQKLCKLPIRDLTCSSPKKYFENPPIHKNRSTLMEWYANSLFMQVPCLRMEDTTIRKALLSDPHLTGIIYHTIKFCDFYSFEYVSMEKFVPVLKLETDYISDSSGQLKTRLEAFFEVMNILKNTSRQTIHRCSDTKYFIGIDIGSTSTDAVILNSDRQLLADVVIPTGAKSLDAANLALKTVLKQTGLELEDISHIITTGYGRNAVNFQCNNITEISCHAKGVNHLFPQARSIIDIGGQDSKVIRLNDDGSVVDFVMNDKCAAGTGRFLELIASTLNISLEQMSEYGLHWNKVITISNMCAVFAESEIISLIAQNEEICDIVHGINLSIASRIAGLAARIHATGPFVMSGGVAKNRGVQLALEQILGQPILIVDHPQICGAFGAALLAMF